MNNLSVIEKELVPVYQTSSGEKVVYGSELHSVLGSPSVYREWVHRRISDIGAVEGDDYQGVEISTPSGQTRKDHIIKLDIAKEMAMLERNDKGKEVRQYFIRIEKKYKQTVTDRTALSPELQMFGQLFDAMAKSEIEQRRIAEQTQRLEQRVDTMQSIMTEPIGDWRTEINRKVREISVKVNTPYQALYDQMYSELESTAHCSLKRLQDNKRERMEKAGNTKTAIKNDTTKIAIIEDKPQLKAIFEGIVKRYAMSCA